MIAHTIKDVLGLVPDALEMMKKASVEEEFPLDSPDSALASYLTIEYLTKVAHETVDLDVMNKVAKAVKLYGISKEAEAFADELVVNSVAIEKKASMIKTAADAEVAQAAFEGNLTGFVMDLEKVASDAHQLVEVFEDLIDSEEVLRYAGKAYLHKEAAAAALEARYQATGNDNFLKVAEQILQLDDNRMTADRVSKVCQVITGMDKQAHLETKGFNFYKEALLTKQAEVASVIKINVGGRQVPYESIAKLGPARLGDAVGKDVVQAIGNCPVTAKQVLETLPLDSQKVLSAVLKASGA